MSPKLIALGVIAIVLSIMMMIIAPPQDTTHHSADAGYFASCSVLYLPYCVKSYWLLGAAPTPSGRGCGCWRIELGENGSIFPRPKGKR